MKAVVILLSTYNGEKYLKAQLDSLFSQSYKDFRLIARDDGSTDSTFSKILLCKEKYQNINVVNQQNEGLSSARNVGLSIAKGKYIWFVDSDDWVEENCLKDVIDAIENDDLIVIEELAHDLKTQFNEMESTEMKDIAFKIELEPEGEI